MKKFNEEKKLAVLYLSLRGRKKKRYDWIYIANICKELEDYYGSTKKVAKKAGVSYEQIRTILKLLKLPKEVQRLIKEGKILQDAAQRIARIRNPKDQIKVAKSITGLRSHDARELMQYAKTHPNLSLEKYKKRIVKSKKKVKKIRIVIIPFEEETYDILNKISNKKKITPSKLIKEMVDKQIKNWRGVL